MLQRLVASFFAKNQENVKQELCLNLRFDHDQFLFALLSVVLSLGDVPKKVH